MTTQQQENVCSVFNCSGMYPSHSKCGNNMVPDYKDVLQNHSINSLIAKGVLNAAKQEQELLGLNSPRGLLGGSFGNYGEDYQWQSPSITSTPIGFQCKLEKKCVVNYASVASTPIKRNVSLNSNGNSSNWSSCNSSTFRSASLSDSTMSSVSANSPIRSTSLSDSSGSNSPSVFDSFYGGNLQFAAESDNSAVSSPDGNLTDILNTLTLKETFNRSCLNNNNVDMITMQNLQSYNNYLQKPPSSFYPNSPNLLNFPNASSMPSAPIRNLNQNGNCVKWPMGGGTSKGNQFHRNEKTNLDRAARFHRSAASHVYDATCTWSGILPERKNKPSGFSSKVFIGGAPWDISEQILMHTFSEFGPIKVQWPGKENQAMKPKGYVYIIFESEKNVKALLQACASDFSKHGNWYYKVSSKRMRAKDVQVIPWNLTDACYSKTVFQKLDPTRSVFVGGLHGMLNAEGLATIMNDLFDGVVYAGIDTDKYKYPIGSGRVTFNNSRSYMKAVAAGFISIKTGKFEKTVQVDPYIEEALCSICGVQQGPYFCRELTCFRYFCRACWFWQHTYENAHHKPLMRNSKNSTILGLDGPNNMKYFDY